MRRTVPVVAGFILGLLSALGQAHFDGTLDAFANSLSTWLVAPFVAGTLMRTRRGGAIAGLTACAFQLAGYYLVTPYDSPASLVVFWCGCAVIGGPVFGVAGQGRATAVLAGLFVAEGVYAYLHQQQQYLTGALWIAIGVALGHRQLRRLAVTVPLGLSGEVVLTGVLRHL